MKFISTELELLILIVNRQNMRDLPNTFTFAVNGSSAVVGICP